MKLCRGCNKVLADARCPTCGELGVNTQIIHRPDPHDSSIRRRISTVTEEDPNQDDVNRINDA